jgi:hypothetical protein
MAASTTQNQKENAFSKIMLGAPDKNVIRCCFCERPAALTCSVCKAIHYCSRECSINDWQRHKHEDAGGSDMWKILTSLEGLCLAFNPLIRVKHTGNPDMGLGVFAREDIKAGTKILDEHSYICDVASKLVASILAKDDPLPLFQFWSLEHDTSLKTDEERAKSAIFRNGLMDTVRGPTSEDPIFALFFTFSRFNHSCGPNAIHSYNTKNHTINVFASRDLKKGEEITLYWHHAYFIDRDFRNSLFKSRFGKKCLCDICTKEDKHVMDEVMSQATECVFETLKHEGSFHDFLTMQDAFSILSLKLIFRNMLAITDMLHGFSDTQSVPYSAYRKIIYKNFARFLSTYPGFIKMKKTNAVKKAFNGLVQQSINYFKTIEEDADAASLTELKIK